MDVLGLHVGFGHTYVGRGRGRKESASSFDGVLGFDECTTRSEGFALGICRRLCVVGNSLLSQSVVGGSIDP